MKVTKRPPTVFQGDAGKTNMSNRHVRRSRIYVAGPLNALAVEYIINCREMMVWAEQIRHKGYSVYVPCLDLLMGLKFTWMDYYDYFENSQPWLDAADAVFLCPGWKGSAGTLREIERARYQRIPIYESVSKLFAEIPLLVEEIIASKCKP